MAAIGLGLTYAASAGSIAAAPLAQEDLGARIYAERCAFCHGADGDGNGPVADDLLPRPRDFTGALYKVTTTTNDSLASDDDLIRAVRDGLHGTAMPAWSGTLRANEIAAVVEHLKTFAADDFATIQPEPIQASRAPRSSGDLVARGRELFAGEEAQCYKCHGLQGRGDGESAAGMTDDWDEPIYPANLTKGWRYKGGTRMEDIFMRLSTGMDGTPMPSFLNSLTDDERWALAAYVNSLARPLSESTVVTGIRVDNDVPRAPDDPVWDDLPQVLLPLAGQVVFAPRWQTPSIDAIGVQVAFNDTELAVRLTWGDRFHDTEGSDAPPPLPAGTDTYVSPVSDYVRNHPPYSDRVRLQFPATLPDGLALPYFIGGSPNNPVVLWEYDAARPGEARVLTRAGQQQPPAEADTGPDVSADAIWQDGEYRAVFVRARFDNNGLEFPEGRHVPFALQAFDGDVGETSWVDDDGTAREIGSVSAWYTIVLKPETQPVVYLWAALALVAVAGGEWGLARFLRRRGNRRPTEPPRSL